MAKTKKKITVMLGELTKALKAQKVDAGTTLSEFLSAQGFKYSAQVRVNGEAEKAGYKLKADDIVTVIGEVNGGHC
jgi:hypothetical protein